MVNKITVWDEIYDTLVSNQLKSEARKYHQIHQLPDKLEDWRIKRKELRNKIWLKIDKTRPFGCTGFQNFEKCSNGWI